jgi:hypothetical protein
LNTKLLLLSFILIGMVATTTADEPIHHRDEPQDHDVDVGRVFGRSTSKRQDAVGETKKTKSPARRHRHRYVVVVPPTTTGKATKRVKARENMLRSPDRAAPF